MFSVHGKRPAVLAEVALNDARASHRTPLAIQASSNDSVVVQQAFTSFAVPASVSSAGSAKAAIATMPHKSVRGMNLQVASSFASGPCAGSPAGPRRKWRRLRWNRWNRWTHYHNWRVFAER